MAKHVNGTYWGALWVSVNRLDGRTSHLVHSGLTPKLFRTRAEMRAWIDREYGFIRERPDLRAEPHGWRLPRPILVRVVPT